MPTYRPVFRPRAAKAFDNLNSALKTQVARKLTERLNHPHVQADAMRELPGGYRPKFRASGLRLVYQVRDTELVVLILAIGPRDRDEVYRQAMREWKKLED